MQVCLANGCNLGHQNCISTSTKCLLIMLYVTLDIANTKVKGQLEKFYVPYLEFPPWAEHQHRQLCNQLQWCSLQVLCFHTWEPLGMQFQQNVIMAFLCAYNFIAAIIIVCIHMALLSKYKETITTILSYYYEYLNNVEQLLQPWRSSRRAVWWSCRCSWWQSDRKGQETLFYGIKCIATSRGIVCRHFLHNWVY